ncbi:MAG TPA: hypothetical protein VGK80_01205 [Rhodanobacteraceae bacterium]
MENGIDAGKVFKSCLGGFVMKRHVCKLFVFLLLNLGLAGCHDDRVVIGKLNLGNSVDVRIVREIAVPTVSDYFTVEIDDHATRDARTVVFGATHVDGLRICYKDDNTIYIYFKSADIDKYKNYYYAGQGNNLRRYDIGLYKSDSVVPDVRCISQPA